MTTPEQFSNQQGKTILTITGSDGTGESGIQADLRFIHEMGGTAASVITSITAQNTLGIQEFYDLPATAVTLQMEAIINDLQPAVVKIGLLRRIDVVVSIARLLRRYCPEHVIYAPVVESARGERLLSDDVFEAISRLILPLCTVVMDNLPQGPHGRANQLSSTVAVLLCRGESPEEALLHAHQLMDSRQRVTTVPCSRSDELFRLFTNAVERYYKHYADVAFYAEELNVSQRYLGQVTRRIANSSPKAIIDRRITKEIIALITTTAYSLKEIAAMVGFSSQAQLSRFFKKQTGVSPSSYLQHQQPTAITPT